MNFLKATDKEKRDALESAGYRLKQPKSCARCRKLWSTSLKCLLQFEQEKTDEVLWKNCTYWEDIIVDVKPVGKCPKPLSIDEACRVMEILDNKKS